MMGSASPAAGRGPALVCFELAQKQRRIKIMATGYDKAVRKMAFGETTAVLAGWLAELRTRIRIMDILARYGSPEQMAGWLFLASERQGKRDHG